MTEPSDGKGPDSWQCFDCRHVSTPFFAGQRKCPHCGSDRGKILSAAEYSWQTAHGLLLDIDPATGRPIRRKR